MNKKRNKRRYNLHYNFRKKSGILADRCVLNAKQRNISCPIDLADQISENKYAISLRNEFQYMLQL
jgi:hypothetical protein